MARTSLVGRFGSGVLGAGSSGVELSSQLYAAALLPVFIVLSLAVARALHSVFLGFLPDSVAVLSALRVVLGTLMVIATGIAWILWVRTGGFGLFARE